ncbi:DNA ligase 3, variant 2 [Balamuthia mandrillaris]
MFRDLIAAATEESKGAQPKTKAKSKKVGPVLPTAPVTPATSKPATRTTSTTQSTKQQHKAPNKVRVFRARLLREDGDAEPIYLEDQSTLLGRGDLTGVTDKRCSRKQVELVLSEEDETVTLIIHGTNPTVTYRPATTGVWEQLSQGDKRVLNSDDRFALLFGEFDFRLQTRVDYVEEEDEPEGEESHASESGSEKQETKLSTPITTTKTIGKRKLKTSDDEEGGPKPEGKATANKPSNKKAKTTPSTTTPTSASPRPKRAAAKKQQQKKKRSGEIDSDDDGQPNEYDPNDGFLVADDDPIADFSDYGEDDDDDDFKLTLKDAHRFIRDHQTRGVSGGASAGHDKPACMYGKSCYRKNPQHLKNFWHPPKDDDEGEQSSQSPTKTKKAGKAEHSNSNRHATSRPGEVAKDDTGHKEREDKEEERTVLTLSRLPIFKNLDLAIIRDVLHANKGEMSPTLSALKEMVGQS